VKGSYFGVSQNENGFASVGKRKTRTTMFDKASFRKIK
jgi:hypothetical protein